MKLLRAVYDPKVWSGSGGVRGWQWAACGLLAGMVLLFGTGLLAISGALIRSAAERPPILDLMLFFVAVRFFGFGRSVLRYVERLLSHELVFRQLKRLRLLVFDRWAGSRSSLAEKTRSADLLQRWMTELEQLQEAPLRVFLPIIAGILLSVVCFALLALVSMAAAGWYLALVLWLAVAWPWICSRRHARLLMTRRIAAGKLHFRLAESREAHRELAMNGALGKWHGEFSRRLERLKTMDLAEARWSGLQDSMGLGVVLLGQLILLFLLAPPASAGILGWPLMVGTVLAFAGAMEGFQGFVTVWNRSAEMRAISRRLLDDGTEERGPAEQPVPRGPLSVRGLTLAYGRKRLFHRLSFELPATGIVLLRGPSGSGKTSLLRVLAGVLEPCEGSVFAECKLDAQTRRGMFDFCPQDVSVFTLPLRQNLSLGDNQISDVAMLNVLEKLGLGERLSCGNDPLDAMPEGLSGGELKRIGLARAFLGTRARVIMDEPFEHLDGDSSGRVVKLIKERAKSSLVLVATHLVPAGLEASSDAIRSGKGFALPTSLTN